MSHDDERPRVGISRCLLGDAVRYDGAHRRDEELLSMLGSIVEWVPVCPEVEVGMSTPREPIDLVEHDDGVRALANNPFARTSSIGYWRFAVVVLRFRIPSPESRILPTRSPARRSG